MTRILIGLAVASVVGSAQDAATALAKAGSSWKSFRV
jgi:hypothetical protein